MATELVAFLRSKYGSDGVSVVNMAAAPSTYCGQRWTFAPDNRSVAIDLQTFIDALVDRAGLSNSYSVLGRYLLFRASRVSWRCDHKC